MSKAVFREVKVLDAIMKEEEGTDDQPTVVQYIWLLLQDVKTERVFSTVLHLDDIKDLTKMERYLQGTELIKFGDLLKSREYPVSLVFNPEDDEITLDMIKNEKGT